MSNKGFTQPVSIGLVIILIVGVSTAWFIAAWLYGAERTKEATRFDQTAQERIALVQKSVDARLQAVHSLTALFYASQHVDAAEFRTFIQRNHWLDRSIHELLWIPKRGGNFPVEYAVSLSSLPFRPLYDYNLWADPRFRGVLQQAVGNDIQAASFPFMSNEGNTVFFLVAQPVYGKDVAAQNVRGVVVAIFDMGALVSLAMEGVQATDITLHLENGGAAGEGYFIHHQGGAEYQSAAVREHESHRDALLQGAHKAESHIIAADHQWLIQAYSRDQAYQPSNWHFALPFLIGLCLSLMIAAYFRSMRDHTTRLQAAKERMRKNRDRLENAQRIAHVGSWDWSIPDNRLEWSDEIYRIFGLGPRQLGMTYEAFLERVHPEDRDKVMRAVDSALESGSRYSLDHRVIRPDGEERIVHEHAEVSLDTSGRAVWMQGTVQDVTARRHDEERLRLAAAVFEHALEGVMVTDAAIRIVAINKAFTQITGFSEADVLGNNPRLLKSGQQNKDFYQAMWTSLEETGQWQGELLNRRKNGEVFPAWQTIKGVRNEQGELTHYVALLSDITGIKQSQQKLNFLAHHDALTRLPNRLLFNASLDQARAHAYRVDGQVAVLFLDLDGFKNVNDSLGHGVGDQLLCQVAGRLKEQLRNEDMIARLGGDEFAVLVEGVTHANDAGAVAEKLHAAFKENFHVDGHALYLSASIGISLYPSDGTDAATLMRNADAAMYRAKDQGRDNYQFYTQELTHNANERLALAGDLRLAIERGQLALYYQPKMDMASGILVGLEALLRWQHPEHGAVSPARFIPLAEDTGLILPIGEWVLRTAAAQAHAWHQAGYDFGRIAVNISGQQLQRGDLLGTLKTVLTETDCAASLLELEVTEGFIMGKAEWAVTTLERLRQTGVTLAIDDFGTGYSSLSYLKKLPINILKVDQSFVRDIPEDRDDEAITRAVIALGHSLGLSVVAEGVETEAQRAFLLQEGCEIAQGYLYSRPVPADEFTSLFLQNVQDGEASPEIL